MISRFLTMQQRIVMRGKNREQSVKILVRMLTLSSGVIHQTMACCTALYCTVLYCTVLYCTILYCASGALPHVGAARHPGPDRGLRQGFQADQLLSHRHGPRLENLGYEWDL